MLTLEEQECVAENYEGHYPEQNYQTYLILYSAKIQTFYFDTAFPT